MTFRAGLDEHLAAISARDIDRFAATVSRAPYARVVAPDGGTIAGHDAIVGAHRGWFAGGAWTFEPRVLMERANESLGFALLEVTYTDGEPKRFLLSVAFERDAGVWKLFFDQNTPLP